MKIKMTFMEAVKYSPKFAYTYLNRKNEMEISQKINIMQNVALYASWDMTVDIAIEHC